MPIKYKYYEIIHFSEKRNRKITYPKYKWNKPKQIFQPSTGQCSHADRKILNITQILWHDIKSKLLTVIEGIRTSGYIYTCLHTRKGVSEFYKTIFTMQQSQQFKLSIISKQAQVRLWPGIALSVTAVKTTWQSCFLIGTKGRHAVSFSFSVL